MRQHSRRLLAVVLVGLVMIGVGALATGRVAYVTTSGVSVEPTYSAGDLVVVVPDDGYEVGDAVAYTDPGTGGTVLHRIVEGDGESGFRLRGDNNQSIDPHEPHAADLVGRAVLHVPQVGGVIGSPITKALLLITVTALIGSLIMASNRTDKPEAADGKRRRGGHQRPRSRVRTVWIAFLVVDVVLLAAVAAAFFTRPADDAAASDPAAVEQDLELFYTAEVPRTETYPDEQVQTGDPVFRSLVDAIDVTAATSAEAGPVSGEARLDVTVTAGAGWTRTVPLVELTRFTDELELDAEVDLTRFQSLADRIAAETGVSAGSLDLTVAFTGTAALDGGEETDFVAALPFRLTEHTLAFSGENTFSESGPVVASSVELPAPVIDSAPTNSGTLPDDLTRPALVALLLAVGITAVIWPTKEQEADEDPVVRVRTADLHRAHGHHQRRGRRRGRPGTHRPPGRRPGPPPRQRLGGSGQPRDPLLDRPGHHLPDHGRPDHGSVHP